MYDSRAFGAQNSPYGYYNRGRRPQNRPDRQPPERKAPEQKPPPERKPPSETERCERPAPGKRPVFPLLPGLKADSGDMLLAALLFLLFLESGDDELLIILLIFLFMN